MSLKAPSSLQILLAEDHFVNQKIMLTMLQKLGCQAMLVKNGAEVLEAMQQQSFALILMDVQMPIMDGLTATREIHQIWTGDRPPRIIATTASWNQELEQECRAAGMDGYLCKPIELEALKLVLQDCSAERQPQVLVKGAVKRFIAYDNSWRPESRVSSQASFCVEGADQTVIDRQILALLQRDMGKNAAIALPCLIDCYLAEAPKQIQKLQKAVADRDAEKIHHTAHTLKASSRSLGATSLFITCKKLEDCGRMGILEPIATTLFELEQEFERFKAALEQEARLIRWKQ